MLRTAHLIERDVLVHHAAQRVDDSAVRDSRRRICVAEDFRSGALKVKHRAAILPVDGHR